MCLPAGTTVALLGALCALTTAAGKDGPRAAARSVPDPPVTQERQRAVPVSLPLAFQGWPDGRGGGSEFVSRGPGWRLALTPAAAQLSLAVPDEPAGGQMPAIRRPGRRQGGRGRGAAARLTRRVTLRLLDADPHARGTPEDPLPGRVNYLFGSDPAHWITGVPVYAAVRYRRVYPGVDAVYYGQGRELEYDLSVSPGADPHGIRIGFEGVDGVRLDANGNLLLAVGRSTLCQRRPVVYQQVGGTRRLVAAEYDILAGETGDAPVTVALRLGVYDPARELVIDPSLGFSTYLGGSDEDYAYDVAVDAAGNSYVAGAAGSIDFPLRGSMQGVHGGDLLDAFVAKINPNGTGLVYSTYIGGMMDDEALGVAVDASGRAVVAGATRSGASFPHTANSFDPTPSTGTEGFLLKLNAQGTGLVYGGFLGGSTFDEALDVALDANEQAYVTGATESNDFPLVNALGQNFNGLRDAFVTAVTADGAGYVYSTWLGGSDYDRGNAIAVTPEGQAVVAGETSSNDFPVVNAFQAARGNASPLVLDAFVSAVAIGGGMLVYSTFLGGSLDDLALGVAVDAAGSAVAVGVTDSINYPVTPLAFQTIGNGGEGDSFVTRLTPEGSALVFSTYLGGTRADEAVAVALDGAGVAHVVGTTESADFPLRSAIQRTFRGPSSNDEQSFIGDAIITSVAANGRSLAFSTFLGGTGEDFARGVAVGPGGRLVVAGVTNSSGFPTTGGALQTSLRGNANGFVVRVDGGATPPPAPPTELQAFAASDSEADLEWIDNSNNEDEFSIERRTGSGSYVVIASVGPDVTAYRDSDLQGGGVFTYRVRAFAGGTPSAYSNEATVQTPVDLGGRLLVTPAEGNFKKVKVKKRRSIVFTLTNQGIAPLTGNVLPPRPPFRILQGEGPFALSPGNMRTVTVEFAPRKKKKKNGVLIILSADSLPPTVRVPLKGKGK